MLKYLTYEQIMLIHSFIIEETTGSHGIRDRNALLSAVAQPKQITFGQELYPTIFTKAAVYLRNIIFNHPFVDGNKRTAVTTAIIFIENNGFIFRAKKGEIEKFALKTVQDHLDIEAIALWLKKNTRSS